LTMPSRISIQYPPLAGRNMKLRGSDVTAPTEAIGSILAAGRDGKMEILA
jgi:hypothetical protein